MRTRQPVLKDILRYFPATAELALVTMILLAAVGIPLGVVTATARKSVDLAIRTVSVGATALPGFWLALVLQFIFFFKLNWFPPLGRISSEVLIASHPTHFYLLDSLLTGSFRAVPDVLAHMAMPVIALVAGRLSIVVRMTRASLLQELQLDYVRTARSKGLSEARVPIVTELGLHLGWLLGGAVFVVEFVFTWPGIGLYAIRSILALDYMPIMATTVIMTVLFVLINLLVDISYTFLNPRIRY
jgi:peptide/nickel transport system permease protein